MPSSYVSVDYEKITQLFKKRGTTRSKCAKACEIHPATLGNAFSRKSKMRADYLKRIAAFLEVQPIDLLLHDKEGNIKPNDWDAITSKSSVSKADEEMEEVMASSMRDLYVDLNDDGREILYSVCRDISDLLHQIPKYLIDFQESEK